MSLAEAIHLWKQHASTPNVVLLDGFHPTKHALRFNAEVLLMLTADRAKTLALAEKLASDVTPSLNERLVEVDRTFLTEIVGKHHDADVIALARRPDSAQMNPGDLRQNAPVIALDTPHNLGNVGAVIRVAAGFGAAGVLTTGNVDPWHPHVLRGAAGLHFAQPVLHISNDDLIKLNRPLIALDPEGKDIRGATIPDSAVLVFGSERHGLSPKVRDRADSLLALPMRPGVSSYNLATSVAMTAYHWLATKNA